MTRPRALVLRAPGINCEQETCHAFELTGATPELIHIRRLCAEPELLDGFAILAVPGGFAYGDDIAAGRVLANEMRQRLGPGLVRFVERGGLVLGICNGFQVLVRIGLLPRTAGGELRQQVTLTHNLSNHYECRWVTLKSLPNRCVFVEDGLTLRVPAAHGEGYLQTGDEAFARVLIDEGYAVFVYVDESGRPTTRYPDNPNGSPHGLAGLTDHSGRVLGLMPHPDRAYLPFHAPDAERRRRTREPDGLGLFAAMVRTARAEA
jgi:phosphoribosylformylglycinamidine synthase